MGNGYHMHCFSLIAVNTSICVMVRGMVMSTENVILS